MKKKSFGYARVGLLGNPSDHYGGKCISFTFDKKAEVTVQDNPKLIIENGRKRDFDLNYNGSNDLIKAVIKNLGLENEKFKIEYNSEIPFGSGLAGSSAIAVAAIRALKEYFGLDISEFEIAERSRNVETEELGIDIGFQDGYSVAFGGILYMDFKNKELPLENNYGVVKRIPARSIPIFLCLSGESKKSSGIIHGSVRERFLRGGKKERAEIKKYMSDIAGLAEQGFEAIKEKNWEELGRLMNENRIIRNKIYPASRKDNEIAESAIKNGALGVKLTGSGGASAILADEKNLKGVFEKMKKQYSCFMAEISNP